MGGRARGPGKRKSPVELKGNAPVGSLGDDVPPNLKQNVKLVFNFTVFMYKIQDFMSIGEELGRYIVHTIQKNSEDSMGG